MAVSDPTSELVQLTRRLLDAISDGDWATYEELCDPSLTAFEPEAPGQLVQGLPFHRFYFELGGVRGPHQTTVCSPHVRVMGDVAVVAYARLIQKLGADGAPATVATNETRIWQRQGGKWRNVHFHRSAV
jgi:calcium/calmodulin-dependent protein kinase (CaM kinase) II